MSVTINLVYDTVTRLLSPTSDYAGTTVDTGVVGFHVDPIPDTTMDLVYGVIIKTDRRIRGHPFSRLDAEGNAVLYADVLSACAAGSLPVSLRVTHDSGTVESSREYIFTVSCVPSPLTDSQVSTSDLVMTRNTSWDWVQSWPYEEGALVVYNGAIYVSLAGANIGNEPTVGSAWWQAQTLDSVTLGYLQGLTGNVQDQLDSKQDVISETEVSLSPMSWDDRTQRIENPAFIAGHSARAVYSESTYMSAWEADVSLREMEDGYAVFGCSEVPTSGISVKVMVLKTEV